MNDVKNFVMISPNFPKTYYKFAESLKNRNININECLYVGDSDVDMLTAKNAQIDAVAVT